MEEEKEDPTQQININIQNVQISEDGEVVDIDQYAELEHTLQVPSSIVKPKPLYKHKENRWKLYFVDLVEDNVRNRCVFPFVALAFYITLVLSLQTLLSPGINAPEEIALTLPMAVEYNISQNLQNNFPALRVKASNKGGTVQSLDVEIEVFDISIPVDKRRPNCDLKHRKTFAGSLEYLRLQKVCMVIKVNNKAKTSDSGIADFSLFQIGRGPQGSYGFKIITVERKFSPKISEGYSYLKTNVANLEILTKPITVKIAAGQKLPKQPKIKVTDILGNAVAGKVVTAYSWPEPRMHGKAFEYKIEAGKFAWLKGDISQPSDANGIAKFTSLEITGATSDNVYIFFTCDALATAFWGTELSSSERQFELEKFQQPLFLLNFIGEIKIVRQPSLSVLEGATFAQTPIIELIGSSGEKLLNKLVFAKIYSINGEIMPYGYRRIRPGHQNKDLLKPIPGVYDDEYDNPLLQTEALIPILTDKNGRVEFKDLHFSIYGATGVYRIKFVCEGFHVISRDITVKTSVQFVTFSSQPPKVITEEHKELKIALKPIIQIKSKYNRGIRGKTPEVRIIKENGQVFTHKLFDLALDTSHKGFSPSQEQGFILLYFNSQLALYRQISFYIEVTVDGITTKSDKIDYTSKQPLEYCGHIIIESFPTSIVLGSNFRVQLTTLTKSGKAKHSQMDNQLPFTVSLEYHFVVQGPTAFPGKTYSTLPTVGSPNTVGSLLKTDMNIDYAPEGTFYVRAIAKETGADTCYSSWRPVLVSSKISRIKIMTDPEMQPTFFNSVKMGDYLTYNLKIFDKSNNPVKESIVKLGYNILQRPPYVIYTKIYPETDFLDFIQVAPNTNSEGVVAVKVKIQSGFPGQYYINFKIGGIYSRTLNLITDFPVHTVEITKQPKSSFDPKIGHRVGEALQTVQITVKDITGRRLPSYTVIAALNYKNENYTNFRIDFTQSESYQDQFIVMSKFKIARTDTTGIAAFTQLSVMDVADYSCISFVFFVGQPMMFKQTVPSDQICFFQDVSLAILTDATVSNVITQDQEFDTPISVKIRKKLSYFDTNGPQIYVAYPYLISGQAIAYPNLSAKEYLSDFICVYESGKLVDVQQRADGNVCNLELFGADNQEENSYIIKFTKMRWIKPISSTAFKLTISTPLNYMKQVVVESTTQQMLNEIFPKTSSSSTESGFISITNSPDQIQITTQPNNIVYVGDHFQTSVNLVIKSGSPISGQSVKVALIQYTGNMANINPQSISNLMDNLAQGKTDIKSSVSINADKNVLMDLESETQKTNSNGQAFFNIRIFKGYPGYYTLQFQTGKLQSDQSSIFVLMNRIQKVQLITDISQTVDLDVEAGATETVLSVQPRIKITFDVEQLFLSQKYIDVFIYPTVALKTYLKQVYNKTVFSRQSVESSVDEYEQKRDRTVIELIVDFYNAMANKGVPSKKVSFFHKKWPIKFSYPEESLMNGKVGFLNFTDLSFEFPALGNYQIVFGIDGIETDYLDGCLITVQAPKVNYQETLTSYFESILVISSCLLVLIANSAFMDVKHSALASIGIVITTGLIYIGKKELWWKILMSSIFFIFIILICEIRDQAKGGREKQRKMIFHARQEIFFEYVFQHIHNRPSKYWEEHQGTTVGFQPYEEMEAKRNKPIDKDKVQLATEKVRIMVEEYNQRKKIKLVEKEKEEESQQKQKSMRRQQTIQDMAENKTELELVEDKRKKQIEQLFGKKELKKQFTLNEERQNDAERYELKMAGKGKWHVDIKSRFSEFKKSIFRQFDNTYIGDAFFQPQIIMAAMLLSIVSVGYIFYSFGSTVQQLKSGIDTKYVQINDAFNKQMNSALNQWIQNLPGVPFPEQIFKNISYIIEFIHDQMVAISIAMIYSFNVCAVIALVMYILAIINLMRDFKRRIVRMRRGNYGDMEKQELTIADSTEFMGFFLANSAFSFVFIWFFLGLACTPLFLKVVWTTIFENMNLIYGLFTINLLVPISLALAKNMIIGPDSIHSRRGWSYFELYILFMSIISTMTAAVGRIISGFVAGLIGMTRIDKPIMPTFMLEKGNKDGQNKSYISAVLMYHTHNHPMCIVFANLMGKHLEHLYFLKSKDKEEEHVNAAYFNRTKLARKFMLMSVLKKYPQLKKDRVIIYQYFVLQIKRRELVEVEEEDDKKVKKDKAKVFPQPFVKDREVTVKQLSSERKRSKRNKEISPRKENLANQQNNQLQKPIDSEQMVMNSEEMDDFEIE